MKYKLINISHNLKDSFFHVEIYKTISFFQYCQSVIIEFIHSFNNSMITPHSRPMNDILNFFN